MAISRLSKTDVAKLLGCYNEASNSILSRELRKGYFTDDVLGKLNMTLEDYLSRRRFTHAESMIIIAIFDFDHADLESLNKVRSQK